MEDKEGTMAFCVALPKAKAAFIRGLGRDKKLRDAERAFIIEGARPIRDLLNSHAQAVLTVVVTETFLKNAGEAFRAALRRTVTTVYVCRDSVFDTLTDLVTAPGIMAIVQQPTWKQESLFNRPCVFGLYGEGLQDPTNVGAIIRTAAAFEMDGLWLSSDSSDIFNPKVVRATAGTLLQLPIFSVRDVKEFEEARCALLAAQPPGTGSRSIRDIRSIPSRAIMAFGNESRGLSTATLNRAPLRFHIPVNRHIDSLNVAAAAAIAAFHFRNLPRRD
jgi:TrmH family RNA methyltransferase